MKIRKGQIFMIASLVTIFVILIAIQYFHFRGIKDSLERLVNQKTKGQYRLELGETEYDFVRLDFSLKHAHIYRIDTLNEKRIYTVELPYVRINLGSLESYFNFGQINVKEFEIAEPVILLRKQDKDRQKVLLSSEFARLLDIINEILDSFNIHSFKITKGAFDLSGGDQNLRINLIDFLAQEWNVRKLTNESQIKIAVGSQQIALGDFNFSFDHIDYNYQERQLIVSGFTYHHRVAETGADVSAKGETFIIYHVDWQELSSTDRYKLKRIELIRPEIRGSFPLPHGRKKDNDFFKILYSTLGDFLVDSLIVRDADVNLSYKQKKDSTSVSFRNANFTVTDFQLKNSKEYFEVGEVRFNLNQTELTIGRNYVLRFDSLFYNHHLHHRLRVRNLSLSRYQHRKPFLTARQTTVSSFNPFEFMMNKKIAAEALELSNVSLALSPELFQTNQASSENDVQIDLKNLNLFHADVTYRDVKRYFAASDLNVRFHDIQIGRTKRPVFEFSTFSLGSLAYDDEAGAQAKLSSIVLRDRFFSAESVTASQRNGLSVQADHVATEFDPLEDKLPDHLTRLYAGKLQIRGSKQAGSGRFPLLRIDRLSFDTLLVDVQADKNSIQLNASSFLLHDLHLDSATSTWSGVNSKVSDLALENPEWKVAARHADVNSRSVSTLREISIVRKDSAVRIQAAALSTGPFAQQKYVTQVNVLNVKVNIDRAGTRSEGVIDSLLISGISLDKKPAIGKLVMYHPIMQIIPSAEKKTKRISHLDLPAALKEIVIDRAEVTVERKSSPVFIHNLNASWTRGLTPRFSFDSLTTETKQDALVIAGLKFDPDEVQLGRLSIHPLQTFSAYSVTGFERDWLSMEFKQLKIKGYTLDSLVYGNMLDIRDFEIGAFKIDAFRDKRMPDGPFKKKELFSSMLESITYPVSLPVIRFNDGTVTVKQISDKTQETGVLVLNAIAGDIKGLNTLERHETAFELNATAQAYGHGKIRVAYRASGRKEFKLNVTAEDMDLMLFNPIVQPLQSVRFKSGKVNLLTVDAAATDSVAVGNAQITYTDARIEVLTLDKTNFRNDIVSAIANEVIRNKRRNFAAPFTQEREQGKSEFAYWVKMVLKGASTAARHGKKQK